MLLWNSSDFPHDLPSLFLYSSCLSSSYQALASATLPSESTKIDLRSGHYKTATILGCGRREIKPHHKASIIPSPENSHKWDTYCCLFSRPHQGLASAWDCDSSSPDLMDWGNISVSGHSDVLVTYGRTWHLDEMLVFDEQDQLLQV